MGASVPAWIVIEGRAPGATGLWPRLRVLTLYVDADACPVKGEIERVAGRHAAPVVYVSNSGMRRDPNPLIRQVVVADGPDAADDWIVANVAAGDIVITADIPLASRCLEKAARVLSPQGKPFTPANIGMALGMRELSRHLREVSGNQTHHAAFAKQDRSRFLQALENEIQAARRRV